MSTIEQLASARLPRYFLLKSCSNYKYLRHVNNINGKSDLLVCDGDDISSTHLRFQVEKSKSDNDYFHIRCCYNNRYWTFDDNGYVHAEAKDLVEDTSKGHWTLFKVESRQTPDGQILFRISCKLRDYVASVDNLVSNSAPALSLQSISDWSVPINRFDFLAVDWETFVILPRIVTFKGDNGKYLKLSDNGREINFGGDDRYHSLSMFEIFTNLDGTIRIKNGGKCWRGAGWVFCNLPEDTTHSDKAELFEPFLVGKNVIALRNLGTKFFCRRTSKDGYSDRLGDAVLKATTICKEARLEIDEPVSLRKISDIRYREDDLRFYNESKLTVAEAYVSNDTTERQEVELTLSHEYQTSHTWSSSHTRATTTKFEVTLGIPKMFLTGKYEYSEKNEKSHQWGEKNEYTEKWTRTETVPVNAGKKIKVTAEASRSHCDIPFSYTFFDRYDDGSTNSQEYEDGIYTGVGYFDFKTDVKEV